MQRVNRSTFFIIIALTVSAGFFFWNRFADEKRRVDSHTREITPRGSLADIEKMTISIYAQQPNLINQPHLFRRNANETRK